MKTHITALAFALVSFASSLAQAGTVNVRPEELPNVKASILYRLSPREYDCGGFLVRATIERATSAKRIEFVNATTSTRAVLPGYILQYSTTPAVDRTTAYDAVRLTVRFDARFQNPQGIVVEKLKSGLVDYGTDAAHYDIRPGLIVQSTETCGVL